MDCWWFAHNLGDIDPIDSDGHVEEAGEPRWQQMDDDALSIINGQDMLVPGEEGMRDIRIVEAVYRSAALGERVLIG